MLGRLVLFLALLAAPAFAIGVDAKLADPAQETRARAISRELRCLVCQNKTIAESHADLAIDLKNQIREKIRAGASDDAIMAYMVERYGDFVLYRPPFKATTLLLWVGPFMLLAGAFGFLVAYIRRRRQALEAELPLGDEEHARARQILSSGTGETRT